MRTLLTGPFRWRQLFFLATRERAEPALRHRLGEIEGFAMPEAEAEELRRLAMIEEFHATHLERRLHEALEILEQAGIETMILKGAALAYTVYGSFAERPMGDLDLLLLDSGRAKEARDLLRPSGWDWSGDIRDEARYAEHHHLPPLGDRAGTGLRLELHTALFPRNQPFHGFAEDFVARRTSIPARDRTILIPDLPDQLLHICLHFAWSHVMQVGAWRTMRDVDTIVRNGTVEWPAFVDRARSYRAERCCYWTLRLARAITDAPIPDTVLDDCQPRYPSALLGWLEHRYLRRMLPTDATVQSARFDQMVWQLGIQPERSSRGAALPWNAMGPEAVGDTTVSGEEGL
ncbi:MAG: hypothetical protein HKM89_05750 [Gemmatimonadales bacterium]|nr:hypothetical protein [Gemmatimonadales bacterium]